MAIVADDTILAAWEAGRARWPDVALDLARFAAHVRALDHAHYLEDLYLAAACLGGDRVALACFDREILDAARKAVGAIDARREFVDEAVQRLRDTLMVGDAPRLAQYAGRGPLRAWVGIAATRIALMMKRSQKRAKEVSIDDDEWTNALATISTNNPELELLKGQYADAFRTALRDAVRALEPRFRGVLRMSFVDALSSDEIGNVYAVLRATAARWVQRACDEVFAQTRTLLAERLALTGTELDRMTALVQSQLDVSLSQLLLTR